MASDVTTADYAGLLGKDGDSIQKSIVSNIVAECRKNGFDGIVLDTGYVGLRMGPFEETWFRFLESLGSALHAEKMVFILVEPVISRSDGSKFFSSSDLQRLLQKVDFFSLMTYDYSGGQPGPNSPLFWMTRSILELIPPGSSPHLASKLLMGIPFYGRDGARALIGTEFLSVLQEYKTRCKWDENDHEHVCSYRDANGVEHKVYYPTLQFLKERLDAAKELGVGVAVWEIGQGLDYFYDLL